jgi:hypothetical protein
MRCTMPKTCVAMLAAAHSDLRFCSRGAALIASIVPLLFRRNPNRLHLRESFDGGLAVVTAVTALLETAERHVRVVEVNCATSIRML